MLQQTQVKTVVPYYDRFLKQFPDIESLAQSSEQKILKLWSGLGYYNRARNLRKAAKQIVKTHGAFPTEYDAILALPGIGRYTAGAICSLALNQPRPVVDGNIRRVLARLNGIRGRASESYYWNHMTNLLPEKDSSCFNQAMMELGALICVPFQPHCVQCPIKGFCEARRLGIQKNIPQTHTRRDSQLLPIVILLLEQGGKVLLARADKPNFIPGEWGLPCRRIFNQESAEEAASALCRNMLGHAIELTPFAQIRHSITNYRIVAHGFCATAGFRIAKIKKTGAYRWAPRFSRTPLLTSSLFHKMIQKYESESRKQS